MSLYSYTELNSCFIGDYYISSYRYYNGYEDDTKYGVDVYATDDPIFEINSVSADKETVAEVFNEVCERYRGLTE